MAKLLATYAASSEVNSQLIPFHILGNVSITFMCSETSNHVKMILSFFITLPADFLDLPIKVELTWDHRVVLSHHFSQCE